MAGLAFVGVVVLDVVGVPGFEEGQLPRGASFGLAGVGGSAFGPEPREKVS